jgi:hypothetical protein
VPSPLQYVYSFWFSQTEHLLIGYHKNGLVVKEIRRVAMGTLLQKWEMVQQDQLKKLVTLIEGIKKVGRSTKVGKFVLLYNSKEEPRKLRVLIVVAHSQYCYIP